MRSTSGKKSSWIGRQARVDCVQDGANTRDGKIHFQVAMAVPLDNADPRALFYAQRLQRAAKPQHPLIERVIGVANLITVNNLLVRCPGNALLQYALEQQLIIKGRHFSSSWLTSLLRAVELSVTGGDRFKLPRQSGNAVSFQSKTGFSTTGPSDQVAVSRNVCKVVGAVPYWPQFGDAYPTAGIYTIFAKPTFNPREG
jgi:hypothetical protein